MAVRRPRLMASTSRKNSSASSVPSSAALARNAGRPFGQAPPAIAQARPQERATYPRIGAQDVSQDRDVGVSRVAYLGYSIDERDLCGEEGISRDLGQLSRGWVRYEERDSRLDLRRVDLAQDVLGLS